MLNLNLSMRDRRTHREIGNVSQRKTACVAINEVPQVSGAYLQSLKSRVVEVTDGFECNFRQHRGRITLLFP